MLFLEEGWGKLLFAKVPDGFAATDWRTRSERCLFQKHSFVLQWHSLLFSCFVSVPWLCWQLW